MDLDVRNLLESLVRWMHVLSGIAWVGQLYLLAWTYSAIVPEKDAQASGRKRSVLAGPAHYLLGWGSALSWITGSSLLALVYYTTSATFADPDRYRWTPAAIAVMTLPIVATLGYDLLSRRLTKPVLFFVAALAFVTADVLWMSRVAHFSFRGSSIHLGALTGTFMVFNVWFRILPANRAMLACLESGQRPDPDAQALAATRARHNVYLSVPLVFTMLNQHATWAASSDLMLPAVVLVGWLVVHGLLGLSKKAS